MRSIGIDVTGTLGTSNATEIRFNSVGVGKDGSTGLGQSGAWAVGVSKADDTVVADNVIGNGESGLAVAGSSDVTIVRNAVGTDRLGISDQDNTDEGIIVQQFGAPTPRTGIVIGGSTANGNLVRNNPLAGIKLESIDQSTVAGNVVDGNGFEGAPGVSVQGNTNTIGPDNVVTNNGASFTGVAVLSGVGNTITQNSIDSNIGLGIDLGDDGVTANDAGDGDSGPNDLQNYPVPTSAVATATKTHVDATLDTVVPGTYRIEVFNSTACDGSGNGEGANFVGSGDISFTSTNQAFTITVGTVLPTGSKVTLTATAPDGSTSEFSACATVTSSVNGLLQGRVVPSGDPPATQLVDLTAFGTADWAVWGFAAGGTSTSLTPDVRKSGGTAIGSLANINPAPSIPLRGVGQFAQNNHYSFSWQNGTSPATATHVRAGLQHDGQQTSTDTVAHGFSFDLPADTTPRTARIWVSSHRADSQLTATLSDDSATPFADTLVHAFDSRTGVYTITYAAQSAGQTLHVQWTESTSNCGISFCDNAALFAVAVTDPTNTLVVTDPADTGGSTCGADCTLRQAINAANAAPGSHIVFNLPAGQTTISPATNLPALDAPTTIDAATQPGYTGSPVVTLDGGSDGSGFATGFFLNGDGNTIRGFAITGFSDDGIFVGSSGGNTIAGNYIGVDVDGNNSQNNGNGITLQDGSDDNTIGGTGSEDRNVISANGGYGIDLTAGDGGSPDNNTVLGNYIGLRPDGTGQSGVSGNVAGGIRLDGDRQHDRRHDRRRSQLHLGERGRRDQHRRREQRRQGQHDRPRRSEQHRGREHRRRHRDLAPQIRPRQATPSATRAAAATSSPATPATASTSAASR